MKEMALFPVAREHRLPPNAVAGTFDAGSKLLKEIGLREARLIKRLVETSNPH
jgi:hypothetical protein